MPHVLVALLRPGVLKRSICGLVTLLADKPDEVFQNLYALAPAGLRTPPQCSEVFQKFSLPGAFQQFCLVGKQGPWSIEE